MEIGMKQHHTALFHGDLKETIFMEMPKGLFFQSLKVKGSCIGSIQKE
jgi:hypothetical protein